MQQKLRLLSIIFLGLFTLQAFAAEEAKDDEKKDDKKFIPVNSPQMSYLRQRKRKRKQEEEQA